MLYTIQTVSKQLHSNRQDNNGVNIAKFFSYEKYNFICNADNSVTFQVNLVQFCFNNNVNVGKCISYETNSIQPHTSTKEDTCVIIQLNLVTEYY